MPTPTKSIFWSEQTSPVVITSALAALIQNGGALAGQLDCRSGGNAAEMLTAAFRLTVGWGTVTGITSGTAVADLFLVPLLDGSTPDAVQITNASTDYVSYNSYIRTFTNPLASPVINTLYPFGIQNVDLQPLLYNAYVINRSGQTFNVNGVLSVLAADMQYT